MRKPLKYQIMLPMSFVMLTTLILFSVAGAWMAGHRARRQIEGQLRDIAATLAQSTFPLTDRVLKQMRGLSGAEFLVAHFDGTIAASSGVFELDAATLARRFKASSKTIALNHRVRLNSTIYFHVPIVLNRPSTAERRVILHCFYPESTYQQAWREAALPPLLLGTTSLIMVVAVSSLVALRVTRPIQRLRNQVDQIARGEFAALAIPNRNDELQDLSVAINRMAEMLAKYESNVRKQERLKTLDRLGGGIAHQLRNSVTGCRIAVDLQSGGAVRQATTEAFPVAVEQLELMEKYLRKFLSLGKDNQQPFEPVDLAEVVSILPLVRPRSEHLGVMLEWHPPSEPLLVAGDADALSQVVVNLLLNAVEAASQRRAGNEIATTRLVTIHALRVNDARVGLEVFDSGEGPAVAIQDQMFEPLISGKQDGVGLGLAMVREIVERHGGAVRWSRSNAITCFAVELPLLALPLLAEEVRNAHVVSG